MTEPQTKKVLAIVAGLWILVLVMAFPIQVSYAGAAGTPVDVPVERACSPMFTTPAPGTDVFAIMIPPGYMGNSESFRMHNFTFSSSATFSGVVNGSTYSYPQGYPLPNGSWYYPPPVLHKHGMTNYTIFGNLNSLTAGKLNVSLKSADFYYLVNGTKDSWFYLQGGMLSASAYNATAIRLQFSAKHIDFFLGHILANQTHTKQYQNLGMSMDNFRTYILVDCNTGKAGYSAQGTTNLAYVTRALLVPEPKRS